jgi:hypothetical protein
LATVCLGLLCLPPHLIVLSFEGSCILGEIALVVPRLPLVVVELSQESFELIGLVGGLVHF